MRWRHVFLLAYILLSGGCAVFSSDSLTRPVNGDGKAIGLSYALPKAVIRGKVVVDPASAAIVMCLLAKPVAVADASQQYYMPFNNNPFSADMYTILKDDTTGRLTSIDVKTIDRFDEFAINLAKSVGAVSRAFKQEGAQLSTGMCQSDNSSIVVLATMDFDPADERRTSGDLAAINEVVLRFARQKAAQCSPRKIVSRKVAEDILEAEEACREYHRIAKTYSHDNPPIRMRWLLPSVPQAVKPDCSVGFCYRHTLPHTVQLAMAGSSVHSYTYQLPNASPIVAMDINRAITVTKTTKIEFGELGQITKINVQKGNNDGSKGSEAEGLALVPANVVNAYFGALSETAKIIGQSVTSEKELIDAKKARDQAEMEAVENRRKLSTAVKQEGGISGEEYAVVASNGLNAGKVRIADTPAERPDKKPETPNAGGSGPQGPGTVARP